MTIVKAAIFLAFFGLTALAQANTEIKGEYVVEPVIQTQGIQCPRGTKVIAKYCWDGIFGAYMQCGHVCHPISNIGNGGGTSPTNP